MLKQSLSLSAALLMSAHALANTQVEMKTTLGNIEIELYDQKAPVSAKKL